MHRFLRLGKASGVKQRGFTMVEAMVAVAISIVIGASINFFWSIESNRLAGQRMAGNWKPYYQALQDYVQNNKQTIVAGGVVAGVVNPLAPTVAELRGLNLLPTTYPLTIPGNGGTPIYRLGLIPAGCVPAACDIEYYVGTPVPELNGNGTVNERLLSNAAQYFGSNAGYSTTLSAANITGVGGWVYPNPSGSVGGLFGIYTTYSQSGNSAYVRIGDNRDPALTGKLTVAGDIAGSTLKPTLVAVVGGSCATQGQGALAQDASGNTLSCQAGLWKKGGSTGLGVGQTWHNLTASRASGVTYTNGNSGPLMACANTYMASWGVPQSWMYVDGVLINQTQVGQSGQGSSGTTTACGVVPAGSTYSITCNTGCANWAELY